MWPRLCENSYRFDLLREVSYTEIELSADFVIG